MGLSADQVRRPALVKVHFSRVRRFASSGKAAVVEVRAISGFDPHLILGKFQRHSEISGLGRRMIAGHSCDQIINSR
jgi:hypothetical protein